MRTPAPKLGAIKRTSKGKVRTIMVTWGNIAVSFWTTLKAILLNHPSKNQLERTMSVHKLQYHVWSEILQ
jgi:hypothetical protein